MGPITILMIGLVYLALLFGIATWAERRKLQGKSVINNGTVYALSLGVYCTAWTYYGSVGRAASSGIDFLSIYLGPTMMAAFFWPVLRKIIRISKVLQLTSLADFVSTRYGKNFSLAVMVTVFAAVGLIPYIALQIKSITHSVSALAQQQSGAGQQTVAIAVMAVVLMVFTMFYGARSVDTAEKHEGLVAVIAFESVVKLVAFLAVGIYVTYGLYNGFGDLFSKARQNPNIANLLLLKPGKGYFDWMAMLALSMFAILLLPRQFQVGVVENVHEKHVYKAIWMLPLYFLLINLFVLPIAVGGMLSFGSSIEADSFVLALPLADGKLGLSVLTWLGGFAAATGMIVVETIALSIMISNNLIMPILLRLGRFQKPGQNQLQAIILWIRRGSIAVVLALALLYSFTTGESLSLVSIGLISFCAVAQFAPAVLGGIFWKGGNKNGAVAGLAAGFALWIYTLALPHLWPQSSFVLAGLGGQAWLKPQALFYLEGFDPAAHALFWSLLVNVGLYVSVSMFSKANNQDRYHAEWFVDVFKHGANGNNSLVWRGVASLADLTALLGNFIGTERSQNLMAAYANRHAIPLNHTQKADPRLVAFTERILGSTIGTASARIIVSTVAKEEELQNDALINILRENQQTIEVNKELRRQGQELQKTTRLLEVANTQLKQLDAQKDEFLYTVTHELRTPLTSIRALSEIVQDNPDLPHQQRQQYLEAIGNESERLSELITKVLLLERYETGRHRVNLAPVMLAQLIRHVVERMQPVATAKNITITCAIADWQALVQAEQQLITQVLYNLLGNAVKFAKSNILVALHADYQEWQVSITDDGKGIDPALHQFIFDKFFQAHNQTLTKPEGTGLGLAISKKIVALHGGSIYVSSKPQAGATFVFTLPI
ncbi:MAG: histidine kinase [Bacteroidetes bacterium]|nr:MAG: histidine kinase [Bacteroidota bacterium]